MKRNAVLLTIAMFVSKIFGFIRETVLANYYALTAYADIYFTANLIPGVVFGLVATGLVSTFIPIYSRIMHREGPERAHDYLSNILSILLVLTIILAGLGYVFAEELVKLFASGFEGETFTTAVNFVRISIFAILFNGGFSIFTGYHQYHDRFLVSPLSGFVMNFVVIFSIVASTKINPIVMAYGIVLAAFAQVVLTYIFARKDGNYRYHFKINLQDEYLKPMLIMAVPIIIGSSINQLNMVVDRRIASSLGTGAISTLNYASKISDSIYALFVTTITTVMYPTLTKQAADKNFDAMNETVTEIMNTVIMIVIPATVGLMVLSEPVVRLFYGRGQFDEFAIQITSSVMYYYALGTIAYGLRDVLTRTFYALEDSITPVLSGVLAVASNIYFNLKFAPIMGVVGLAIATSLSALVAVIVMSFSLYKKLPSIAIKPILKTGFLITIASAFMGNVVSLTYRFLSNLFSWDYKIPLLVSIGVGVLVYLAAMLAMDIPEFTQLFDIIKNRSNSKDKKASKNQS